VFECTKSALQLWRNVSRPTRLKKTFFLFFRSHSSVVGAIEPSVLSDGEFPTPPPPPGYDNCDDDDMSTTNFDEMSPKTSNFDEISMKTSKNRRHPPPPPARTTPPAVPPKPSVSIHSVLECNSLKNVVSVVSGNCASLNASKGEHCSPVKDVESTL
jgi:hypothetical protein